ncbi:MAG TPA: hypothetical protein VM099_13335 [Gemmatimonadaceae bacterium]|nr:hypothetical protein [Gemmatimonadaceae bacterium]
MRPSALRHRLFTFACAALGFLLTARFVWHSWTPHYYLGRIFEPHAGEVEAMPAIVSEGIALARDRRLKRVNVGPELMQDPLMSQRFVEGLYPIRIDSGAPYLLLHARKSLSAGCETLEQRAMIVLLECR